MKKILSLLLVGGMLMLSVTGCKKSEKTDNNASDSTNNTVSNAEDTLHKFYLVPAPEDIFGFSEDKNLGYYSEYLNPTANIDKYVDTKLQEFNFGVYAADLAYSAAFGKKDESAAYLDVVKKLSDKIGLSEIFDEKLINKIQNIEPNRDSLIDISNDTYFDIVHYLERNKRDNSIATIAAGGWVETMYLVIKQVEYSEDNPTISKIADQKIIFSNLMNFLKQYQSDPNIASLMTDLKPIEDVFEQLKTEETEELKVENDNKIVVGGTKKLVITKEQFEQLKQNIIDIRNKLTLNNV